MARYCAIKTDGVGSALVKSKIRWPVFFGQHCKWSPWGAPGAQTPCYATGQVQLERLSKNRSCNTNLDKSKWNQHRFLKQAKKRARQHRKALRRKVVYAP